MEKVAFIGNFYKTVVYEEIAKLMKPKGIESYWIMPNSDQYYDFKKKYGDDHVLLIDRSIIKKNAAVVGDYKINEIVYSDRIWRYSLQLGLDYLKSIQEPVKEFIKKNNIGTVFGENTTSEELLICRMCHQISELNCDYFSLMTTRIPNGRFFFFTDEKQTDVWKCPNANDDRVIVNLEVKKPAYLALNDKILKKKMSLIGVLRRLKFFITDEHINPTDPNVLTDKQIRLKVKGREIYNQQLYRFVRREGLEVLKGKKYIFYGFHKQPESSIDVCGRYNENQEIAIENIWRQLPPDWYLVIKEHSNAIGDRSVDYFKHLQEYPNIILVNEGIDSKLIIQDAKAVITNTGTMALEAALWGIPAITLSKVVFNCINYCKYMTWQDFERFNNLQEVISDIEKEPLDIEPFRELVANYSFEGTMGDVFGTPEILKNRDNLMKLANAFEKVAKRYESI